MELSSIEVIKLKRIYTRTFVEKKSKEEALVVLKSEIERIKDKMKSKEEDIYADKRTNRIRF